MNPAQVLEPLDEELEALARSSRRQQAAALQRPVRQRECAVRQRAVAACRDLGARGRSCRHVAGRLRVAPRTLGDWRCRQRQGRLQPRPLGRPCKQSSYADRREALWWMDSEGPHVGLPSLRDALPWLPRGELQELQQGYRDWFSRTHRQGTQQLTWTRAGSVWAADHSKSPLPVDGCYEDVLAVRDLASGLQLAWLPVPDVGAETTLRILKTLFLQHGPPLVLKSDNGPAFISGDYPDLLKDFAIVPLRSPPITPRYNGSCEAGINSMKTRTMGLARDALWTADDLEAARLQANELRCGGPSPQQLWAERQPITREDRDQLAQAIEEQTRQQIQKHQLTPTEAQTQQQVIHRRAVRQVLIELGLLTVTWRSVSQPFNAQKLARIS